MTFIIFINVLGEKTETVAEDKLDVVLMLTILLSEQARYGIPVKHSIEQSFDRDVAPLVANMGIPPCFEEVEDGF